MALQDASTGQPLPSYTAPTAYPQSPFVPSRDQYGNLIGGPAPAAGQYGGQDPFAYTGGSLLTPYNQQFSYPGVYGLGGPQQGSSGSSTGIPSGNPMDPNVIRQWVSQYAGKPGTDPSAGNDPDYWVRTIQEHGGLTADNAGYFGGRITNPSSGGGYGGFGGAPTPMSPFTFGQFGYSPGRTSTVTAPTAMADPAKFSFGQYADPASYSTADQFSYGKALPADFKEQGAFQAPTLDNTNDPGYAFRLKEAQRAITNNASAQGARGGDVAKALSDYASNYASSEYEKVYGRAFGQYQDQFGQDLSSYQAQLAGQQQGFGQAATTAQFNEANRFNAAQLNEQNRMNAYNANWNTASGVNDRNYNEALGVYHENAANQLAASGMNLQGEIASNQLGWQAASGSYDRNYQNALNSYQMQWQQQMDAAGLGLQSGYFGLAANNQGFNQALTGYNTNKDTFYTNQNNQYSRLYGVAGAGANAAAGYSGAAGQNGQNVANLYTGQGNVNAAASIANGNAWGGFASNAGSLVGQGFMYGSGLNPYGTTPTTIPRTGMNMVPSTTANTTLSPGSAPTNPYLGYSGDFYNQYGTGANA